ncbi:hypothetical protein, partial [Chroococcidiopsis sp. CCALA 051]|uniref:hypothetical protein n=1 Tax=Chroococcidiopsis sp. CCALA 051 TaxID=869949 RepID=UPI0013048747
GLLGRAAFGLFWAIVVFAVVGAGAMAVNPASNNKLIPNKVSFDTVNLLGYSVNFARFVSGRIFSQHIVTAKIAVAFTSRHFDFCTGRFFKEFCLQGRFWVTLPLQLLAY